MGVSPIRSRRCEGRAYVRTTLGKLYSHGKEHTVMMPESEDLPYHHVMHAAAVYSWTQMDNGSVVRFFACVTWFLWDRFFCCNLPENK